MKYIVIVGDGMADYPLEELETQTPLQAAKVPNMDFIAKNGVCGTVQTLPEGMPRGSDIAILSILGYDPKRYYTGRAPLEAASLGVPLNPEDVAFRCNLISTDGEKIIDYSAGHIPTEEARVLIGLLSEKLGTSKINFYPGLSYRHIMVWRGGSDELKTMPPHDILGQPIKENLPEGDGEGLLRGLIWDSLEILEKHEINRRRQDEGKNPANMIWLWGQGRVPNLPSFQIKYGVAGAIISAVDLVKGVGYYAGLKIIEVPGATGYIDTNYLGKAQCALNALEGFDFVLVHVEAPDEASHIADLEAKIKAIENIDEKVVGTILRGVEKFRKYKILFMTDHYTPISVKTHTGEPVPFAIYSPEDKKDRIESFDELSCQEGSLKIEEGYKLMDVFLGK